MATPNGRRLARVLTNNVERAVRQIQARAWQTLTSASPVDTGFFRSKWTPAIGGPETSGSGRRPEPREAAVQKATMLISQNAQVSAQITSSYKVSGGAVWIVNNTVYGPELNRGSSAQAPAMFVQRAVLQAVQASKR